MRVPALRSGVVRAILLQAFAKACTCRTRSNALAAGDDHVDVAVLGLLLRIGGQPADDLFTAGGPSAAFSRIRRRGYHHRCGNVGRRRLDSRRCQRGQGNCRWEHTRGDGRRVVRASRSQWPDQAKHDAQYQKHTERNHDDLGASIGALFFSFS